MKNHITIFTFIFAFLLLSKVTTAQQQHHERFFDNVSVLIKDTIYETLFDENISLTYADSKILKSDNKKIQNTEQFLYYFYFDKVTIKNKVCDMRMTDKVMKDKIIARLNHQIIRIETKADKISQGEEHVYLFRDYADTKGATYESLGDRYVCNITIDLSTERFTIEMKIGGSTTKTPITIVGNTPKLLNKDCENGVLLHFIDVNNQKPVKKLIDYKIGKAMGPTIFIPATKIPEPQKITFDVEGYSLAYEVLGGNNDILELPIYLSNCPDNEINYSQDLIVTMINSITKDTITGNQLFWSYNSYDGNKELKNIKNKANFDSDELIKKTDANGQFIITTDFDKNKAKNDRVFLHVINKEDRNGNELYMTYGVEEVKLSCADKQFVNKLIINPAKVQIATKIVDTLNTIDTVPKKIQNVDITIEGFSKAQNNDLIIDDDPNHFLVDIPYNFYSSGNQKIRIRIKSNEEKFDKKHGYYDQVKEIKFRDGVLIYEDPIYILPDTMVVRLVFLDPKTQTAVKDSFDFEIQNNKGETSFYKKYKYTGAPMDIVIPKYLENFNIKHTWNSHLKEYDQNRHVFKKYNPSLTTYIYYVKYEDRYDKPRDRDIDNLRRDYLKKDKYCVDDEQRKIDIDNLQKILAWDIENGYLLHDAAEHYILEGILNFVRYKFYKEESYLVDAEKSFYKARYSNKRMGDTTTINQWITELQYFNQLEDKDILMIGCLDCKDDISEDYDKYAVFDGGTCPNNPIYSPASALVQDFITKKRLLDIGTCSESLTSEEVNKQWNNFRGVNDKNNPWLIPLLRGMLKFQEFKNKDNKKLAEELEQFKKISLIEETRGYFIDARDKYPEDDTLKKQIVEWIALLTDPNFKGCNKCGSPTYNPLSIEIGKCPGDIVKGVEEVVNDKINEEHIKGTEVNVSLDGVNIVISVNQIETKLEDKYKSGIYYSAEYLKTIEIIFDVVEEVLKVPKEDFVVEGYIKGETDGVKIKGKGLAYIPTQVEKDYAEVGKYKKSISDFGRTMNKRYYKESSKTPNNDFEARIAKSRRQSKIDIDNDFVIITNEHLAFIRAFIVYNFIEQKLGIPMQKVDIIAKPHSEDGIDDSDKRKVSAEFTIKMKGYKEIQDREMKLLKTDFRKLIE